MQYQKLHGAESTGTFRAWTDLASCTIIFSSAGAQSRADQPEARVRIGRLQSQSRQSVRD